MTSTLLAEPISNPPDPAPQIQQKQLLYLLRCVDAAKEGTPDRIGIASMFIWRAWEMEYLKQEMDDGDIVFSLSSKGLTYMRLYGGSFAQRMDA